MIAFALHATVSKGTGGFMASFTLVVLKTIADLKGLSLGLREFGGKTPCDSSCFKA